MLSMFMLMGFAGIYAVFRILRTKVSVSVLYFLGMTGLMALGIFGSLGGVQFEQHPPLRLLPLFLSQLVLGLDDFSFRLPGIIAMVAAAFAVYRIVLNKTGSLAFSLFMGMAIYMIPLNFHVAALVEASVWSAVLGILFFCAMYEAEATRDENLIILGSLCLGLGVLCRQNMILYWPVLLAMCFVYRSFIKRWHLVLAPLLFALPYFLTVGKIGHSALNAGLAGGSDDATGGKLALALVSVKNNLVASIVDGYGLSVIGVSATWPWLLFFVAGTIIAVTTSRSMVRLCYLSLCTGYLLYFSAVSYPWVIGRYIAEFLGPCIALTIFLLAVNAKKGTKPALVAALAWLMVYSYRTNLTVHQDLNYEKSGQSHRMASNFLMPYRQALGFLQQQDTQGKFLMVGGVPTYGRLFLWLRGFSYGDDHNYNIRSKAFDAFLKTDFTLADFFVFLRQNDITHFVVQYGHKRELLNREPGVRRLAQMLTSDHATRPSGEAAAFQLQQTFTGHYPSAIDIYSRSDLRYGHADRP
jgi:hypothetical protein